MLHEKAADMKGKGKDGFQLIGRQRRAFSEGANVKIKEY